VISFLSNGSRGHKKTICPKSQTKGLLHAQPNAKSISVAFVSHFVSPRQAPRPFGVISASPTNAQERVRTLTDVLVGSRHDIRSRHLRPITLIHTFHLLPIRDLPAKSNPVAASPSESHHDFVTSSKRQLKMTTTNLPPALLGRKADAVESEGAAALRNCGEAIGARGCDGEERLADTSRTFENITVDGGRLVSDDVVKLG
jgi:hypothetical protein